MTITLDHPAESRAKRLKDLTHTTHDRLDKTIMAGEPRALRPFPEGAARLPSGDRRAL